MDKSCTDYIFALKKRLLIKCDLETVNCQITAHSNKSTWLAGIKPSFITWHIVFIRCWLHVLHFNSAQQCFTTSWTKPKSWHKDKLGSATKMCVYCIELLPLQDYWRNHSPVGFHETHTHMCTLAQRHTHTELAGVRCLFLLWSHGSSRSSRAAEQRAARVGGTRPGRRMDDHLHVWALKSIPDHLICVLTSVSQKEKRQGKALFAGWSSALSRVLLKKEDLC